MQTIARRRFLLPGTSLALLFALALVYLREASVFAVGDRLRGRSDHGRAARSRF